MNRRFFKSIVHIKGLSINDLVKNSTCSHGDGLISKLSSKRSRCIAAEKMSTLAEKIWNSEPSTAKKIVSDALAIYDQTYEIDPAFFNRKTPKRIVGGLFYLLSFRYNTPKSQKEIAHNSSQSEITVRLSYRDWLTGFPDMFQDVIEKFEDHSTLQHFVYSNLDPLTNKQIESIFTEMFHECILEGLDKILDKTSAKIIVLRLDLGDYVRYPGRLHKDLYALFNESALILEKAIVQALFSKLNVPYPVNRKFDFKADVNLCKRLFANRRSQA